MKKSIIGALLLTAVIAHAQEGKVGINTDAPKATIDIQPNANNAKAEAKTNEGILAPRLSKTRIANIETPVEGTLVYATDETTSPISAYTGSNVKVAKITEKGYYFYNGAEWVKAGANGELWAQRDNNGVKETYLTTTADGHDLYYTEEGGIYYTGKRNDNSNTGQSYMFHEGFASRRHNATGYGPALTLTSGRGTFNNPEFNQVGDNLGRIVTRPTLDNNDSSGWASSISTFITDIASPTSYASNVVIGARSLDKTAPNYSLFIEGKNDRVGVGNNSPQEKLDVSGNILARGSVTAKNNNVIADNGTIQSIRGGNIGPNIVLENTSKIADNQANRWIIYNMTDIDASVDGGYKDALVFWSYNKNNVSSESSRPQFIITDDGKVAIGGAYTYSNNPALEAKLTVDGTIKSNTLAQSGAGDRVVYADENGVLKTGVSAAANVKLATGTNIKCEAGTSGTMNFGSVTIGGEAKEAFGFCMKNSAGEYKWFYIYGGAGVTTGNGGAFGTGL